GQCRSAQRSDSAISGRLPGLHQPGRFSPAQGRLFSYTSTMFDPTSRLVTVAGFGETQYQIPNNPGRPGNAKGFGGACLAHIPVGLRQLQFQFSQRQSKTIGTRLRWATTVALSLVTNLPRPPA